jgi:hypothetical protein
MHTGEVLFAEIRNIPSGAAILTAAKPQQARCPMCGQEFAPPPAVVAAIQDQSANQNSKSGILSHCPHCQHSLQFNPFFSDAEDYAEVLRRGLEFSRREKGNDHEETLAHLAALAAHLEKTGKSPEARALAEERDRLAAYRSKDAKS